MALVTCSECGGKVSDQAQHCPKCGAPVPSRPAAQQREYTPMEWGLAILLLVGAVIFIAYLFRSRDVAPPEGFEQVGHIVGDRMRAFTFYVANPRKTTIAEFCERMKERYVDGESTKRRLDIRFYDDLHYTPDLTGDPRYPELTWDHEVAEYWFNPFAETSDLTFKQEIPE